MKFYKILLGAIGALIILSAGPSYAQDTGLPAGEAGWVIKNFDTTISVSKNAALDVTEKIAVDFGTLQKHGIYRDIPIKYSDNLGQNYKLRFKLLSITDASNKPIPYELSGLNTKSIKIGDADRLVTGSQTYVIHYQIERGIRFLQTDELYWNATGNGWGVPIESATATVNFPDGTENIKTECYAGVMGAKDQNCTAKAQGNMATFAASNLAPYEGLTIVAGAPKGTLTPASTGQKIGWFLTDNLSYVILLLTLIAFYIIWLFRGRDPMGKKTIAPEFAPPENLSPSEMGVLKDERADMLDISVGIIYLASRGHLTITELEKKGILGGKDYEFEKKSSSAKRSEFETKLLDAIFSGSDTKKLSELKNSFYTNIPSLKSQLYDDLLKRGYFASNPNLVRGAAMALGLIIPGGLIFITALISGSLASAIISGILLVPFAVWFGLAMPRKTEKGAEALRKTRGFRMFIYTAERYRAKFEEDKNIFSKYLPYAMMFGLTHKWAQAFKGLEVNEPNWYVGHGTFNAIIFADAMSHASQSMGATMASAPQSSGSSGFGGGGFSGGGFGGGGGGSW